MDNGRLSEVLLDLPTYDNNCSCRLSRSCSSQLGIYPSIDMSNDSSPIFLVQKMLLGCLPIEALLLSTLECFYNRSCMTQLVQYMYSPDDAFYFSTLDPDLNMPNETIKEIVDRLMIDAWTNSTFYDTFFDQCAPVTCTYEYTARNSLLIVISTLIGVFGGLSLAIKVTILVIVRIIERLITNFNLRGLRRLTVGIFACPAERQVINRLHFCLLVIILSLMYALSASTRQTTTYRIERPSLGTYQDLLQHHAGSLQCSCSQIAITYDVFLDIQPHFHSICSSDFVSEAWIQHVFANSSLIAAHSKTDFLASAVSQFQLLASLCGLSQDTTDTSHAQLLNSALVETQLLPINLLNDRVQFRVNTSRFSTVNTFINTLDLVRDTTGANMFTSAVYNNWQFILDSIVHFDWTVHTEASQYGDCDCGLSWKCALPSRGMMAGCYPLEALLQTTLTCFYDQECIDASGSFRSLPLSSLATSRFTLNSSLEAVVDELMVEKYDTTVWYEKYFAACAPSLCTYSEMEYGSTSEAVASVISLYGGLVIITRCLAVVVIKMWWARKRPVHPIRHPQS